MKSKNRELLKKILTKLLPYWSLAKWLLALTDSFADEKTVDSILNLIKKSVQTAKLNKDKIKLEMEIKNINKIKNQEELDLLKEEITSLIDNN